jgi:TolB protein
MVGSTDGVAAIELAASTDPNRAVSVPVVSPEGRKVCWSTADNRLYIIGTDKSNLVGLSQQAYYGTVPTFSSDGGRIAFYTSQGELAVVNADGTGERIVANNAQDDPIISLGVAWSPSGDRLVYVGALSNGNRDVFSVRSDGTDGKNLTNDASFETNPSFSPDGTQIVYARAGAGIVLMNADGTGSALLTTAGTGVDLFPEWSSDGTRILYVSRATSGTDIGLLKIVDVASKAITLVTVDVFHGFWSR